MPSYVDQVTRIFGGALQPTADPYTRPLFNVNDQDVPEVLTAGQTYRRVFRGPTGDGAHWSVHAVITDSSAGGAITFFYSNLPHPNPTTAAHWEPQTTTIPLTAVASVWENFNNQTPAWIMAVAAPTGDDASLYAYVRVNGVDEK